MNDAALVNDWIRALQSMQTSIEKLMAAFSDLPCVVGQPDELFRQAAFAQYRLAENIGSGAPNALRAHRLMVETADTTDREYRDYGGEIMLPQIAALVDLQDPRRSPVYRGMAWFGILSKHTAREVGITDDYLTVYRGIQPVPTRVLDTAISSVDVDGWRGSRTDGLLFSARVRFDAVNGVPLESSIEAHPVVSPYVLHEGPHVPATDPAGWIQHAG